MAASVRSHSGGRSAAIPRTSPIIARLRHWRGRGFLVEDRVRHEA